VELVLVTTPKGEGRCWYSNETSFSTKWGTFVV